MLSKGARNIEIYRAYKFRLYPKLMNKKILIYKTFGCKRFVYNYYLNYLKENKSKTKFDFDSLSVEGFTYKLIANPRTIGVKYDLSGLSGWKDVASSVDIFVSRPFVINDLDSTIKTVTVRKQVQNMLKRLLFSSRQAFLLSKTACKAA